MSNNIDTALGAAVGEVVVQGKKFWASKTFWVNVLAVVAIGVQSRWGFVVGAELQALALAGVNLVLRKVTKEPIVW